MATSQCVCPSCGRRFQVPEDVLGKESHCPGCRASLILESIGGKLRLTLMQATVLDAARQAVAAQERPEPATASYHRPVHEVAIPRSVPESVSAPGNVFDFTSTRTPLSGRRRSAGRVAVFSCVTVLAVGLVVAGSVLAWLFVVKTQRANACADIQSRYQELNRRERKLIDRIEEGTNRLGHAKRRDEQERIVAAIERDFDGLDRLYTEMEACVRERAAVCGNPSRDQAEMVELEQARGRMAEWRETFRSLVRLKDRP